jgi:ankyrin repeat protein
MSYLSSAFPRFAEHMEPHEIVFQLAKSGKARQLKQYLNRRTKEDRKRIIQNKYNGATSLIMACRNGHYDVVEYIVEHCNANLEQSGLVNFEGENIEGAPPLWCASAAGHLKIVKYLVSKGANVNSTTKSNSTALRAACFDGHVEIVKFLVENNADIEIANRHGHTCLMIACYKGHLAIAKYLISRGADLNRKSVKGNTALHDCAECGSLDIMKLLLGHQAKMAPDSYQMTPLLAAAVTGHAAIVEYLLTRNECQPVEKILALELLGATFVDKKHDMLSAYNYWKMALERRSLPLVANSGSGTVESCNLNDVSTEAIVVDTPKTTATTSLTQAITTTSTTATNTTTSFSKRLTIKQTPIEAYDYATEFLDKEELDEIMSDPDEVRMQALLIRERILGPTHPDTTYYIR